MRTISFLFLVVAACTKPNPNRCCISEDDCAAVHLPVTMGCDEGKVCRGHVCLEESCQSAADCDLSAPFCSGGACTAMCTDDLECPGNGETADEKFCVSGACAACRTAMDCPAAAPVCANGSCSGCTDNVQCASGVCSEDGVCVASSAIAYVDLTGGPTTDCTQAAPCSTVERSLALVPPRSYVLISSGTFTRTGLLTLRDRHIFIGRGTPEPIIDRTDNGPIFEIEGAADVTLEHLQLSGASGAAADSGTPSDGYGIYCQYSSGAPLLKLSHVTLAGNARGLAARHCTVEIDESTVTGMLFGVEFTDSVVKIDRSTFSDLENGLSLDGGLYTVTNSFITRSTYGASIYSTQAGNRFEFNTVVDSPFGCDVPMGTAFPNNIFARDGAVGGPSCTLPGSIIADTNISALHLKSPDAAPYDYHLTTGSIAIDAAQTSTLDHDFDGDARPKGAGRDVGADEAQ